MRYLLKYGSVFALFVFFYGAAWAEQNDSGREGAPTTVRKTPRSTKWLKALPDGDQPVIAEGKSVSLTRSAVSLQSDKDIKLSSKDLGAYTPVWKGLDKLNFSQRENALLHLSVLGDLPSAVLQEVNNIEVLWNRGDYEQSIRRLRSLEESEGQRNIVVEISWKVPIMTSEAKRGIDIRIGNRVGIQKTCLDFDDSTGNLFAMLKFYDGEYWASTVNFSSDSGQTWGERYWVWGVNVINDIGAAVLHGYFYTGMTVGLNKIVAINRFFVSDGTPDNDYGTHDVVDEDYDVLEIAITSNADFYDNRIYLLAILGSDSLIYLWSDEEALLWQAIPTYIANADHGLDACCNEGYADHFLVVSYVDTDDSLHVARRSSAGWQSTKLDYADELTSVGAYQDRIITAFEYIYANGQGIKYWISYDGGEEWRWGNIAEPSPGQHFISPDVAARKGGGIAAVYSEEVGEPDLCWYRHRDYGTGPGTATWSDPEQFNEIDIVTGLPMTVEWIPPLAPYCHAHGSIWTGGDGAGAYFDRIDREMAGDANGDGVINSADVVYLINYLFVPGSPPPDPLEAGDANCDDVINSADVVYLINYLFVPGSPPPCCP